MNKPDFGDIVSIGKARNGKTFLEIYNPDPMNESITTMFIYLNEKHIKVINKIDSIENYG